LAVRPSPELELGRELVLLDDGAGAPDDALEPELPELWV